MTERARISLVGDHTRSMSANDAASSDVENEGDEETEAEDVLVEEISIDGMCGVY